MCVHISEGRERERASRPSDPYRHGNKSHRCTQCSIVCHIVNIMLLKCSASFSLFVLLSVSVAVASAQQSPDADDERPLDNHHNGLADRIKSRRPFFWNKRPDGPLVRALKGLVSREPGLLAKLLQPRRAPETGLMPRSFDLVATPRRVTKDWLVNEIFDGVVAYVKWNTLGRLSETLIEDLLVEVLDPKLRDLLPRDIATKILNVLFKKLQFFFMFFLNSMFANF